MANYYIIGGDGKEYGPVPLADLKRWHAEGRVNGGTKVRLAEATEWITASQVPELAGLTGTPPSLPGRSVPPSLPRDATQYPPKTSALAVTSLVLGILGVFTCGITALVGLILGIVAMVKISNSRGTVGGKGLALAGTIVSAVFLLFIPVYAAMLLPALAAAKNRAQLIDSVNNEKQLALAVRVYSGDHNDLLPPAATWCDAIHTEVGTDKVFQDPSAANLPCGYAFNIKLDGVAEQKVNPETVMIFESDAGWNAHGGPELLTSENRHRGKWAVALADGSVQTVTKSQLSTLRWDP